MRRWLVRGVIAVAALFLVAQVVPYGRDHSNPPVRREIRWDSQRTRELAMGACGDCHSNLTNWRAYSNIAPASWLIYSDVKGGREHLNFSEWDRPQGEGGDEIVEVIEEGSMPPLAYKPLHAEARLSVSERAELVQGLRRTLARDPAIGGGD
jgi:hypothetical protein